jgi:NAD(P)-dependent dehydrogenase (short-subunit alcohol dehydrogenase family)
MVVRAREALGPLTVVEWNAYASGAGDLLTADPAVVRRQLDIAVVSLVAVVQAALPELKAQKDAAVLVVNGGLGYSDPEKDIAAARWNTMGLAVSNAAKHKLVGVLSQKLKGDGVYVGEAMVMGDVKGPNAGPRATIEPKSVADELWELYRARSEVTAQIR